MLAPRPSALLLTLLTGSFLFLSVPDARSQALGSPDRGEPGDERIQEYLAKETAEIEERFVDDLKSAEAWQKNLPRYREEYLYMLGLWPLPEKTPLEAKVTGTLKGDGYVVDMLHYQSRPRLYVTANLYRPAETKPGERLPAVLYVCGHSPRGRNGNKVAFQSHGIWFARHGYVCLVVDTLQLGEIAAIHHGTYRENRWWWHSRGYTPAGVECWNGVRGIDYLISRPDVDSDRIAVTGISGGGAATFWVAAADERVKVAVPVSGLADLASYVPNRVINGHCDCMFLHNTFQWPWTRIAGLVVPRPMLFVNSDNDRIFPMDANERVINRLERLYSLFGAGDRVDSLVSVGGHAYRQDIRQGVYRFINTHLKSDARAVLDGEVDALSEGSNPGKPPIELERLRVFASDADIPRDELNTTIDQHFVPLARPGIPELSEYASWKAGLLAELKRVTFRALPESIPPARDLGEAGPRTRRLETEPGIEVRLRQIGDAAEDSANRIVLIVASAEENEGLPEWSKKFIKPDDLALVCQPRGIGETRWTTKNPPNYILRCHVLLGRTVDTGRIYDVAATAAFLAAQRRLPLVVAGKSTAGLWGAYAALLTQRIDGVVAVDPPASHMDSAAPPLLNVLRVCDVSEMLGLLAPRRLQLVSDNTALTGKVRDIFAVAGAGERLSTQY